LARKKEAPSSKEDYGEGVPFSLLDSGKENEGVKD
jgi:hypothetical protein